MLFKDLYYALGVLLMFGWPDSGWGYRAEPRRHSSICAGHNPGELVPNLADCRLFYLCTESGEAVVASCPLTMLFNPVSKLCDTAANANCQTTPAPPLVEPSSPTVAGDATTATALTAELAEASRYCASLPPRQELNRITYIGSSLNCQYYYICYYGQALRQQCSANLHWNANIGNCDLPENAHCWLGGNTANTNEKPSVGASVGTTAATWPPANTPATLPPSSGDYKDDLINCPAYGQHIFPHMGRCDFFIYCVKGHAILQNCPFYFYFDIVTKSCKSRKSALCVRDLKINFLRLAYM